MVNDFETRFGGIARLYSAGGLQRLRRAHVCVVGIGGVGSWAVEALARSGVGRLTLVDMDDVCVSNINRQLPAMDGTIGQSKVDVMAQRIRAINPECDVHRFNECFHPSTAEKILTPRYDFVLDAIDDVPNKCLLIARCCELTIPVITSGGAGGRRNPAEVQLTDLALTTHDGLLQQVRKKLRDAYGFPREPKKTFNVPCVFSLEARQNCDRDYGTASFVTGTFGFLAAAHVVAAIASVS